jgi:hypothetical protein
MKKTAILLFSVILLIFFGCLNKPTEEGADQEITLVKTETLYVFYDTLLLPKDSLPNFISISGYVARYESYSGTYVYMYNMARAAVLTELYIDETMIGMFNTVNFYEMEVVNDTLFPDYVYPVYGMLDFALQDNHSLMLRSDSFLIKVDFTMPDSFTVIKPARNSVLSSNDSLTVRWLSSRNADFYRVKLFHDIPRSQPYSSLWLKDTILTDTSVTFHKEMLLDSVQAYIIVTAFAGPNPRLSEPGNVMGEGIGYVWGVFHADSVPIILDHVEEEPVDTTIDAVPSIFMNTYFTRYAGAGDSVFMESYFFNYPEMDLVITLDDSIMRTFSWIFEKGNFDYLENVFAGLKDTSLHVLKVEAGTLQVRAEFGMPDSFSFVIQPGDTGKFVISDDTGTVAWHSSPGADYYEIMIYSGDNSQKIYHATVQDTFLRVEGAAVESEFSVNIYVKACNGPYIESGTIGNVSGDGKGYVLGCYEIVLFNQQVSKQSTGTEPLLYLNEIMSLSDSTLDTTYPVTGPSDTDTVYTKAVVNVQINNQYYGYYNDSAAYNTSQGVLGYWQFDSMQVHDVRIFDTLVFSDTGTISTKSDTFDTTLWLDPVADWDKNSYYGIEFKTDSVIWYYLYQDFFTGQLNIYGDIFPAAYGAGDTVYFMVSDTDTIMLYYEITVPGVAKRLAVSSGTTVAFRPVSYEIPAYCRKKDLLTSSGR